MKIKQTSETNGTSLQGYVTISYDGLVALLGLPHVTDGDKITAEWAFKYKKVTFTIYDYKEDETPKDTYDWHIGGFDFKAVDVVKELFPNHKVKTLVESW